MSERNVPVVRAKELTPALRDYLRMLTDPEDAWNVPQSACDKLEAMGLYRDPGGVTDAGRAALSLLKTR